MPAGVIPQPTNTQIYPTNNLKVYQKLTVASDTWTINKGLLCTRITNTNGNNIGSATLIPLPADNSNTDDHSDQIDDFKGDAIDTYKVNLTTQYDSPVLIKITDKVGGVEAPVFYGYMNSGTRDVPNSVVSSLTASSYAGMLNSTPLLGGWVNYDDTNFKWFQSGDIVFNPRGNGNRSALTVSQDTIDAPAIDYSKVIEGDTQDNKFSASDVFYHALLHGVMTDATIDIPDQNITTAQPWLYIKNLYDYGILEFGEGAETLLNSSFTIKDSYTYVGKPLWSVLVEIVEGVDNLSISEKIRKDMGADQKPVIYISQTNN